MLTTQENAAIARAMMAENPSECEQTFRALVTVLATDLLEGLPMGEKELMRMRGHLQALMPTLLHEKELYEEKRYGLCSQSYAYM